MGLFGTFALVVFTRSAVLVWPYAVTVNVLLFWSLTAFADTLTGKVVKITDGDTLYVLDANYKEHKIRLAGIDAPERKQAYGLASRKHLASIVAGKQVTVEYQKRDRYSGIVGKVRVNGVDVCLEQVKVGFAWHYKKYQHEQSPENRQLYTDAGRAGTCRALFLFARLGAKGL